MKLSAAAKYFDRLPVYDAYSNALLFKAQFDLFDDSRRDAVSTLRRILSVAPGTAMPARLALLAGGERWVVGEHDQGDTFNTSLIRSKYTLQQAVGLALVRTPGQVIAVSGGSSAYAGMAWLKDFKNVEESSRVFGYYEVYLARNESVAADSYLELAGKILRVRATYVSEIGFLVAECDDLGAARATVGYSGPQTYNPTTDTFTGSPASLPALLVRYETNYRYEQPSAQERQPGDQIVLVRKTDMATPRIGDTLTIAGLLTRIISIESESDCWNLTVRP